jgi:tetratricopeptide (TPR) repeat protein
MVSEQSRMVVLEHGRNALEQSRMVVLEHGRNALEQSRMVVLEHGRNALEQSRMVVLEQGWNVLEHSRYWIAFSRSMQTVFATLLLVLLAGAASPANSQSAVKPTATTTATSTATTTATSTVTTKAKAKATSTVTSTATTKAKTKSTAKANTVRTTSKTVAKVDSSRVSQYFTFLGPDQVGEVFLPTGKANLLNWRPKDKEKVFRSANLLEEKAAGLLRNACAGEPLRMFSATILLDGDTSDGSGTVNPNPIDQNVAATTPGALTLSEKYFAHFDDGRDSIFAHEATHAADLGEQVAFSRVWIDYMKRNKLKIDRPDNPYTETLAEVFSDWIVGRKIPDKTIFEQQIVSALCKETEDSAPFLRAMKEGLILQKKKKHAEAIECFLRASRARPDVASAHLHAATSYYRIGKKKEALKQTELTCALYDSAGVEYTEPRLVQFLYLRALLLLESGDYLQAIKVSDKVLKQWPDYDKAKKLKALCLERLKK